MSDVPLGGCSIAGGWPSGHPVGLLNLEEEKMEMENKHARDCTIYMMLSNRGRPEAGICTCGYGLSLVRNDNWAQMYSAELRALLNSQTHQRAQTQIQPKRQGYFAGMGSFIRLGFVMFVLPVMLAASIVILAVLKIWCSYSWWWMALPVCALLAWGTAMWAMNRR